MLRHRCLARDHCRRFESVHTDFVHEDRSVGLRSRSYFGKYTYRRRPDHHCRTCTNRPTETADNRCRPVNRWQDQSNSKSLPMAEHSTERHHYLQGTSYAPGYSQPLANKSSFARFEPGHSYSTSTAHYHFWPSRFEQSAVPHGR